MVGKAISHYKIIEKLPLSSYFDSAQYDFSEASGEGGLVAPPASTKHCYQCEVGKHGIGGNE